MPSKNISLPPLRLLDYKIVELQLKSNMTFQAGAPEKFDLQVDLEHLPTPEEVIGKKNTFALKMDITMKAEEGSATAYDLLLSLLAQFQVHPKYPPEKIKSLLYITGASILYSAAREQFAMLTGRAMWGTRLLPTVRFTVPEEEAAPDAPALTEKGSPKGLDSGKD